MARLSIRLIDIIFGIAVIAADILVFGILGLLMMGYDDNYDESKGAYWSLASMTPIDMIIYFLYIAWVILNLLGILYIGWKLYGKVFQRGI